MNTPKFVGKYHLTAAQKRNLRVAWNWCMENKKTYCRVNRMDIYFFMEANKGCILQNYTDGLCYGNPMKIDKTLFSWAKAEAATPTGKGGQPSSEDTVGLQQPLF